MNITVENIIRVMKSLGYSVFENDSKEFNLNIVGIRTNDMTANTFNDYLVVFWKFKGEWFYRHFPITTDPGTYFRLHPMNPNGTWIMAPAQNKACYTLGKYHGQDALVQIAPMYGYRDADRDNVLEPVGKLLFENAGTYIHLAGKKSFTVDNWSAGCQVFENWVDGADFFELCKKAAVNFGNKFTYTLITEQQL